MFCCGGVTVGDCGTVCVGVTAEARGTRVVGVSPPTPAPSPPRGALGVGRTVVVGSSGLAWATVAANTALGAMTANAAIVPRIFFMQKLSALGSAKLHVPVFSQALHIFCTGARPRDNGAGGPVDSWRMRALRSGETSMGLTAGVVSGRWLMTASTRRSRCLRARTATPPLAVSVSAVAGSLASNKRQLIRVLYAAGTGWWSSGLWRVQKRRRADESPYQFVLFDSVLERPVPQGQGDADEPLRRERVHVSDDLLG